MFEDELSMLSQSRKTSERLVGWVSRVMTRLDPVIETLTIIHPRPWHIDPDILSTKWTIRDAHNDEVMVCPSEISANMVLQKVKPTYKRIYQRTLLPARDSSSVEEPDETFDIAF